jgi:hypothetical protein
VVLSNTSESSLEVNGGGKFYGNLKLYGNLNMGSGSTTIEGNFTHRLEGNMIRHGPELEPIPHKSPSPELKLRNTNAREINLFCFFSSE